MLRLIEAPRRRAAEPPSSHAAGAPTLAAHGLGKTYGSTPVLDSVDLCVPPGTISGLVGPNGSGKTTALRCVVGLAAASAGTVAIEGFPAGSLPARARVGYVPDDPTGLDELTVGEYLELHGVLHHAGPAARARAAVLAEALGIEGRLRSPLASLSRGQRRIVAVVAAFSLDAPLVVLDEAAAALDPEAVIALREIVRSAARRGAAILLATQDLHFAETVCHEVSLLSAGRLVDHGSLLALLRRYEADTLEEAFLAALGQSSRIESLRERLEAL